MNQDTTQITTPHLDTELSSADMAKDGAGTDAQYESGARQEMLSFRYESMHPVESLIERTRMSPDDLIHVLSTGKGVWMNNPDRHWERRAYVLFFSPNDMAFFLAVVACDRNTRIGSVVTVLTQQHYETDRGSAIYPHILRRALRSSGISPELINAYLVRNSHVMSARQRKAALAWEQKVAKRSQALTIMVDFRAESGVVDRANLTNPPGQFEQSVMDDDARIVEQDGFWNWIGAQLAEASIDPESVLAIKAMRAGREPVALTIPA